MFRYSHLSFLLLLALRVQILRRFPVEQFIKFRILHLFLLVKSSLSLCYICIYVYLLFFFFFVSRVRQTRTHTHTEKEKNESEDDARMRFISLAPCCDNVAFSNFLDFSKRGKKSHILLQKKKRALSTHIIYISRFYKR